MIFSDETNSIVQDLMNSIAKDIEDTLTKKMAAHIDATTLSADELADEVSEKLNQMRSKKN